MKGLILCAGKGTRLQSFSNIKPKGLLPVANKPFIYYGIEELVELDIYKSYRTDYKGTTLIPPVCIDPNAKVINCVIGPYVTIGPNVRLESCTLENSILLENAILNPHHYPMANSIISPQSMFIQNDGGNRK